MSHLALILPRLSRYGGVERFAYNLAEALAKEHEVDFLCARAENDPPRGVRAIVLGRLGGFRWVKLLWFLFRAEQARRRGKYDLAISLGPSWNQDLLRVGGGPLKTFWSMSEKAWDAGFSRWTKHLRRLLSPANWLTSLVENRQYCSGCHIVCVSDAVASWVRQDYPDVGTLEVIYNLPDLTQFHPPHEGERKRCRQALLATKQGKPFDPNATGEASENIICMGTATSNFRLKGLSVLIQALSRLPKNWHLYIAGGRASQKYESFAKKCGVEDRVFFCGKVDHMQEFYFGLDIFVLPTFFDACSNAVLEARACGLRVVSSSCNGSSSLILPTEQILPDPSDVEYLVKHLWITLKKDKPEELQLPNYIKAGMNTWVNLINSLLTTRKPSLLV